MIKSHHVWIAFGLGVLASVIGNIVYEQLRQRPTLRVLQFPITRSGSESQA